MLDELPLPRDLGGEHVELVTRIIATQVAHAGGAGALDLPQQFVERRDELSAHAPAPIVGIPSLPRRTDRFVKYDSFAMWHASAA